VKNFIKYLYGCHFLVFTDHRPLTALLSSRVLNRRLQGMVLKLLEFSNGDSIERAKTIIM